MNTTLRLHFVSMVMYVAVIGCMFWAIPAPAPSPAWWSVLGLQGLFLAIWLVLLLRWMAAKAATHPRYQVDFALGLTVQWFGHAAVIPALAVLLPMAEEAIRLIVVICLMGPILTAILSTFEGPDDKGYHEALPMVMPIAIAVIFAAIGGRFAIPVGIAMAGLILLSLLLRAGVKSLFARVRRAQRDAEIERDAKSRFLASASHDLGQPLQSARLFFDQALRSQDPQKREAAARDANMALGAMERLVKQMLDHLRLESGTVEPRMASVSAGVTLGRVASLFEPVAALAGIDLSAAHSALRVEADPDLLERALGNMVDNAIRHSGGSRILIGARRRADRVRFWAIDNGRGVSPADVPTLFDEYAQGSDHGDQERGGFGLGLASVRRLAELMGGKAGIDVNWRNGSAFWLDLPRA